MAARKHTGKQSVLLVLSVISLLYGLMDLVTALAVHFAPAMYATIVDEQIVQTLDTVWLLSAIDGALVLLMGITGIVASRNDQKAFPCVVVGGIAFVLALYLQQQSGGGLISQIASGNINPYVLFHVLLVGTTAGLAYTVHHEAHA